MSSVLGWGRDETVAASDRTAGQLRTGTPGALERARTATPANGLSGAATRLVQRLLDVGVDGKGPFQSAAQVAQAALVQAHGDVEQAIRVLRRDHRQLAAVGGFATGLGGFFTMPVSLPANILEFYLLGTRLTAAIARLRGHDIDAPQVRTAILLTLVGADSDDVLMKAGLRAAPGGRVAALATDRLPAPALMVLNKAVGFRLLGRIGQGTFARLGRAVPVVGGIVGGGLDAYLLGRIAKQAEQEFPAVAASPAPGRQ
ncbi:MAG TPA: EcsC family protein [Intrasporangium sp.]|uniref:EcsC family protein n=1 Tax=Intrasporangium sp. TaxID=1925024 RepID=UPI002D783DEF|nr:EcsC family protein [Intrasporangium sp.]HET7399050.1 EcsC family protein [Intrasporangium sp.]